MSKPHTLFEVSWEVCNKVGGIHTVLSTKAKTLVERYGDDYVAVGPWLLTPTERALPFEEDEAFSGFCEGCRDMGIPVKVGRWNIPGSPRTILVEFSKLYEEKDAVLSGLWEDYGVDSISGGWDYAEPVLFGHAAGRVIERWWEERLAASRPRAVVHCHEWMTGSALLYLKKHNPSIGTVFTTHATMLGRSLSSLGHSPEDGLGGATPRELAERNNVVAKHSLEGTIAREADVFTTVSTITAAEAELLHERAPEPITPNGIDLEVVDAIAGDTTREEARTLLRQAASRLLGEDVGDAAFLCTSGRYEFHNKGFDLLLDAVAGLEGADGRRVVLFFLVPAGNSGLRSEYLARAEDGDGADGPLGLSTHNLFNEEDDPIHRRCGDLGLANAPGSRVKIVHVPIYLSPDDGFLGLPYEAVLRAMDLSCFPSYYEPWGYTPQESLAVGVPTITSDYAGFGRWVLDHALTSEDGVTVLHRIHREFLEPVADLTDEFEAFLRRDQSPAKLREACRATARRTDWHGLISAYETAYGAALTDVQRRLERGVPQTRRPKQAVPVRTDAARLGPSLRHFDVSATLPAALEGLKRLSRNFWWCWDPEAPSLFEDLSPLAWQASGHNPVQLLQRVYPEDLAERADDAAYLARLERVVARLDAYLAEDPMSAAWTTAAPEGPSASPEHPIAYFCAEFGLHESLRIYSGGLGILAGDHLKSASDLNLPFLAVGLFYRMGYLTQRLSPSGEQVALDVENDPRSLPMSPVLTADGAPLEVSLTLPGRTLALRAWKVAVGRIDLYLLDANLPANRPEDRDITRNLYGGDHEARLQQEIVLGRGGIKLLRAMNVLPAVYHMNEGHAAFLTLERVRELVRDRGLTFAEATEFVRATTLFTTHTPVPAGHDRFGEDLMRRYFSDVAEWFGTDWDHFYSLGHSTNDTDSFNMTYLALSFSSYRNGVSKLHGEASRTLLHAYWPGLIESEVPVDSITNGIHLGTWTHPDIAAAVGVTDRPARGEDFARDLDATELSALWSARRERKHELIEHLRAGLQRGFLERGDSPLLLHRTLDGIDEDALWIGFARRFAPYKRAHLIYQDAARLQSVLSAADRPVRLVVAGKAHPRDQHGKDILKSVVELTRRDDLVGKVFFLENYDIDVARSLVHGVDVWLNTPTRMLEASGTSGMKVSANGGLNLSIGDGWWPEAYDGTNGWLIAGDRVYEDQELQDQFDSATLYRLLEEEVVPLFFDRDDQGLPRRWLERVQRNLATVPTHFNTDRMVAEYANKAYLPLASRWHALSADRRRPLKELAQEHQRIRKAFGDVRIVSAQVGDLSDVRVGDSIAVRVELELSTLSPADVRVELVLGFDGNGDDLQHHSVTELRHASAPGASPTVFEGEHEVERSGSYAYGLRVRPRAGLEDSALASLVVWA